MRKFHVPTTLETFFTNFWLIPLLVSGVLLLIIAPSYGIYTCCRLIGNPSCKLASYGFFFALIGGGLNILSGSYFFVVSLSDLLFKSNKKTARIFVLASLASIIVLSIALCIVAVLVRHSFATFSGVCFIAYWLLGFFLPIAAGIVIFKFYRS